MMVTFQEAKAVTHSIVKELQPLSVVLFGSVARHGFGQDLDLLIVMEDSEKTVSSISRALQKTLKGYYRKFDIDPYILHRSLFEEYHRNGSPFLRLIAREGRSLYMKDAIQEWVKQAKEELDTAQYLLKGSYLKGACYHAQQAIEKACKAQLLKKGWDLEKTHSMQRLIEICREYKLRVSVTDDEVLFVDSIYRGRYPVEKGLLPLGEPTDQDADRAVKIAGRIVKSAVGVRKASGK